MKTRISLSHSRRNLNVLIACLLSFSLFTMPFVPMAAAMSRSDSQASSLRRDKSSQGQRTVKATVGVNAPVAAPAPEPFAPVITATKVDALINDDGDGKADPGNTEKIEYTVTISNTGSTDATNVQFTDTIDTHTTLVGGSITTQPIAVADTYSSIGNVGITVPDGASDLLGNDCDPDPAGGPCTNAGLTITTLAGDNSAPFAGTSAQGGQVTATTGDGSFQYNPAPGFEGTDTFTYTVTDGTGKSDTATVTVNVSGMIWFVNAAAGGGGDGRFNSPFNCLVGAGCFSGTTADDPGDFIFLYSGTYNDNAALVLLNNQKLIGAAATVPLAGPGSVTGFTIPTFSNTLPPTNQASPVITSTASGIQLASGNLLRGFTVGNTLGTGANYDILNTSTATVGTLTILEVVLNGTGGLFRADAGGTLSVNFASASTTSAGGNGVQIASASGTVGIGGSNTITGVAGSDVLISGGTVALTCSANITHAAGANAMVSISGGHSGGTVTFSGTLNASSGTGLQFDNADSTYNFNGTTTLNGGDAGIDVLNGSGGTFNFGGTSITNPSGVALNVSASTGGISISGAISKNTDGKLIDFDNYDTGTATISGTLSCTSLCDGVEVTNDGSSSGTVNFSGTTKTLNTSASPAVNLDNNDGGTVNFTNGGLDIDTTSGSGFTATNGGTVTVQGSTNTITTTTGTGLNVANTTIGANGLTFESINVDGNDTLPTNGIVLNSTGTSAGLTVTGTGSAGTGGTIRDASGDGISLTTTEKLSLSWMSITSNLGSGIGGSGINGLQIANCSITSNGDSAATDDSGINVTQLTGTNSGGLRPTSITNTTISNNFEFQIQITNSSATLTDLTMSGNTISTSAPTVSGNLFNFLGGGTSSMKLTLTSGSFTGNWTPATPSPGPAVISGTAISAVTQGTGGHTVNVSGATFTNNNAGVDCSTTNVSTTFSCNVSNNNFQGSRAVAINSFHNGNAPRTRTFNGTFSNNIIGTAGSANSGSFNGRAIDISNEGVITTANYTISGNTINEVGTLGTAGAEGIGVNVGLGGLATGGGATNVTISGNTISNIRNSRGLIVADNQDPAFSPFPTICANISGNTFAGVIAGQAGNGQFMRIRELSGTVNVTQATPTAAANVAELDDANGFNDPTKISIGGTPQFSQPACTGSTAMPLISALEPHQNVAPNSSEPVAVNAIVTTGETNTSTEVSRPSLWVRAFNEIASFTNEVGSLIEPTAYASDEVPTETVANTSAPEQVQKSAPQTRKVVRNHATMKPRAMAAAPFVAGTVGPIIIGTLRPGDSVVITFQVTVNNPPNLSGPVNPKVENQGSVTYAESGTPVLTDDPAVGGGADKTATPVDLFDTTTTLASDLNPSNFGDLVTFTATVAENPAQPTADPTGTVDFIDTSNGNAVICNDVPLSGGSAQCQTSTLTGGSTHNIRADYSGDGNFDPSQSNIVAQVVIACLTNPVVTSTADSGAGTLREAVTGVCTGNTITFNIAGPGPHTITLTTGELPVTKNQTINNNSGESITVSGNNASRVFNISAGKTANIIGLTISGGSAASGAGVLNDGTLTIVNSTLTGNTATSDGGGVGNTATATSLTLINTTVSGNNANGSGGGVVVLGGTMTSINSTITNNRADNDNNSTGTGGGISAQAGTTTLKNTIVAGNFNEDGASDAADDIGGTVDAASSFNLIGTGGAGGLTNGVNSNQVGVANAGLGPLADNGGTTQTHALLSTSSAVEAGSNANLPLDSFDVDGDANTAETLPVDQRGVGYPRVADSADVNLTQTVDIGAYESHPTIEDIPNQSTNEDTVKNVTFNIGDDTGSLIASVQATSSNTTLVPNANLAITGSGGSRNLQITPAANQSGTTTITITVTATNGRTATDTFDLTVSAVNDPPSGTDNTVSTAEDTAYTFTAADFGFTDPNDSPANTFLAVKITTLPGLGTLTNNNVAVNAGDFISVANINGGLLKFTPAPNGFGTPYTTFTFQVQDNGGGTDLDPTPNTMTINVTGVNDAPVNTVPGPQVTNEDVALVFSSGNANQISVADVDAGANPIKVTLTATNGTITLSTTAGLAFITGDGTADATMMFTGTLTAVNTALNGMSFTGTANFSGAASLQIVSDDQGNTGSGGPLTDTDSVNITINAVNDPPAGTDNTVSTAEDTAYTFTAADFGFTDPNDTPPNTLLAVKITTLPGLGTLTNNNVPVVAGNFIPVADINGGLLKFTPAADGNGTPYTTFTFQVQDNGGGTDLDPTPNTMTINVTAVNDGPVNTVPGPQSTTEDTPKVFSAANLNQISVADVDAGANPVKITLTATNGTITLSTTAGLVFITGDGTADATMMFTGTLTAVNTALNGMSFTPTLDFNGAASLQIVSDDQGNTGSGGPLTDTDTVNITVTAQNDAPVVTTSAGNTSYTENAAATAIDTGLTVTDVDSANLVGATVAITSGFVAAQDTLGFTNQNGISGSYNSGTGVLTLSGSSSVANYQTALRSVTYANSSDNPTTSRTVTFIADDGSSTSTPATKGIAINAVNDAPVNVVPGPQGTNQNTPLTFSSGTGNQISVTDVDAGTNAVQVTLTATNGTLTLNGTSGLAFTVGDGTADATMTFTGTLANINTALNGMTFTPTAGFSGAATLTITTNDQGNSGSGGPQSDTDVINIQVSTNVTIQDAQVAEPKSGSVNMIFTVTLSAPAPAGGSSVNYTTVQLAPAINHATAGQDYTTTAGTLNFAAGEQVKTILVPVLSDNKKSESNETFEVQLSNPVNCNITDGTATGTIIENDTAGTVLISELRTSGPAGAGDDFVEIYNNSDSPHVVNGTNGGYGLFKMGATCNDTPVLLGVIPNGTTIPARGHYLFVGSAYSLANYGGSGAAAGDQTMAQDIESDRNVAIFSTGSLLAIGSANRLDAVGFGSNVGATCDLFREGTTLTPTSGSTLEHSYFRDECGKKGNPSTFGNCPTGGLTKDSNVNADDFIFADTNATATAMGQRLGAPGPQNLGSPRYTIDVVAFLLDSTKGAAGNPNRVRDTTAIGPNAATGTMSIRRRFQNNTGAPVTKLRIRVVDISTTFIAGGGVADLRLLTSGDTTDTVGDPATCTASGFPSTPCVVTIRGTVLETPPAQPLGGGFNASATTGVITLANPLPAGASINLQLVLGVQTTGSFKFFFNVEALP